MKLKFQGSLIYDVNVFESINKTVTKFPKYFQAITK